MYVSKHPPMYVLRVHFYFFYYIFILFSFSKDSSDEDQPMEQRTQATTDDPTPATTTEKICLIKDYGKQMEQQHRRLQESIELGLGKLENKLDNINVSL